MFKFLKDLDSWVNKDNARTWASHAIIAALLMFAISGAVAIGYYLLREGEQVLYRLIRKEPLDPVDHIMDVVAPAAAVGILSIWF